jgi:hypothetical protein
MEGTPQAARWAGPLSFPTKAAWAKRRQLLERQCASSAWTRSLRIRAPHGVLDIPLVLGADEQHPGIMWPRIQSATAPNRSGRHARGRHAAPGWMTTNVQRMECHAPRASGSSKRGLPRPDPPRSGRDARRSRRSRRRVGLDLVEHRSESKSPLKLVRSRTVPRSTRRRARQNGEERPAVAARSSTDGVSYRARAISRSRDASSAVPRRAQAGDR